MADLDVLTLPVLPLSTGVVLPSMVVTIALETDEARAAADAASSTDGRVLLVPRIDGRYAAVGTVVHIEDSGQLLNGLRALVVRGLHRATIGAGVPGTGSALWVQVEEVEEPAPTEEAQRLAREYKAVVESILEQRGATAVIEGVRAITEPGQVADMAGYSPDLTFEQKVEVLEATAPLPCVPSPSSALGSRLRGA